MSISSHVVERSNFRGRIRDWWRGLSSIARRTAELDCCGRDEVERLAKDVGVTGPELHVLAGKWPDSLDLLRQRTEELKLDVAEIAQVEPQVVRDLQRTCALCASKRRCRHDLVDNPADPAWQDYCPNAMTLTALLAERGRSPATSQA